MFVLHIMTKHIFSEFFDHESEFCLKKDLVIIDDKVLDGLCTAIRVQKQKRLSWKDQSQQHDVDQYFKFFFFSYRMSPYLHKEEFGLSFLFSSY